jgi:uncharacterized protein (DUF488 family)
MTEPPVRPVLHTIGYERRTIEEVIALLEAKGIGTVVDVRDNPWSHKPGFSRRPLEAAITAGGLGYVHAGFAGNPKRLRASAGSGPEVLAAFARHLDESPEILERLAEVVAQSRGGACLLCFERDPADCHRAILAERWASRTGGRVVHLDPGPPTLFPEGEDPAHPRAGEGR